LNKYDLDHLSFAPYSNVESQPASQENRETGAQINQTDNINDTTSDGDTFITNHLSTVFSERFESGIIDYDNRTVSSMGSGISHLSTDGSLLMGECFAPPGKLGIAIDTLNGQPVVHRVREESPLSGVLRRLDVIAAIDDEDTTSMSAAAVTTLMAKKMDQKRKITYLRGKSAQRNLIKKLDD
jgi:C-terminal processing protease CtpA/Prc